MPGGIAENFPDVILTLRAARNLVTWFVVVILTLILLDVNEKYGQGVLRKLITGRYHRPVAEERIFLFMDLVGSTPAAERLGDQKFFDLLSAVYFDATESILNTEGEVSGYVGDEIIISWSLKDGLRNGNCLHCFFSVTDILEARKDFYLKEFDVIPAFRGAVHLGTVTAGEIGVIKKDIMYAGDVLNSTERILGLAKKYDVRLLISASVHDRLHNIPGFAFTLQDTLILRGRKTESMIYRVARMPADVS
jgi:adenylate cyclase